MRMSSTGVISGLARTKPIYTTPNYSPPDLRRTYDDEYRETVELQHCYVCKQKYTKVHHFYDQLCPPCAEFNYHKRTESADLHGRVALLTGGRIKIGYQAGIKLLRAGAELIVTTRFPRDAALRYAREPDFADWGDRLEIIGLDLRHTPSVEAFCRHCHGHSGPARLHRQQRLPDGTAAPGFLPAHDGAGDGHPATMPEPARALLGAIREPGAAVARHVLQRWAKRPG